MTILGIRFELKPTLVIIVGFLLPMIDLYHHNLTPVKAYDRFLLYFIVPAAIILIVFRDSLSDYGMRLGAWKEGIAWTIGACIVMAVVIWYVGQRPEMVAYYKHRSSSGFGRALWLAGVDLFAWEFIWRGFTLFALSKYMSPGLAIWVQAIPFAFAHLGKPEIETLSTIFGGAGFGFVAWRSKSFFYPFLIHLFVTGWTIWVSMQAVQ